MTTCHHLQQPSRTLPANTSHPKSPMPMCDQPSSLSNPGKGMSTLHIWAAGSPTSKGDTPHPGPRVVHLKEADVTLLQKHKLDAEASRIYRRLLATSLLCTPFHPPTKSVVPRGLHNVADIAIRGAIPLMSRLTRSLCLLRRSGGIVPNLLPRHQCAALFRRRHHSPHQQPRVHHLRSARTVRRCG